MESRGFEKKKKKSEVRQNRENKSVVILPVRLLSLCTMKKLIFWTNPYEIKINLTGDMGASFP